MFSHKISRLWEVFILFLFVLNLQSWERYLVSLRMIYFHVLIEILRSCVKFVKFKMEKNLSLPNISTNLWRSNGKINMYSKCNKQKIMSEVKEVFYDRCKIVVMNIKQENCTVQSIGNILLSFLSFF